MIVTVTPQRDVIIIRPLPCKMNLINSLEIMYNLYVPRSDDMNIIGTKWMFRNKMDEDSSIVRNKAKLVVVGIV